MKANRRPASNRNRRRRRLFSLAFDPFACDDTRREGPGASPPSSAHLVGPRCPPFALSPRSLSLPCSGRTSMRPLLSHVLLALFPSLLCAAGLPIYLWHEPEWFD